jgi:hypothetical protein
MANDDTEVARDAVPVERDYEPPILVDFGLVFEVTNGSGDGAVDNNGQKAN